MPTGLHFERAAPGGRASPTRADIACFVGFADVRPGRALRAALADVRRQAWSHAMPENAEAPPFPLPLPVDSVSDFDALFERVARAPGGFAWEAPLAGAVRDFFRQGGQRAWVLAVAPAGPQPTNAGAAARRIGRLVPGAGGSRASVPSDRTTWRGVAHLAGLPEVSLLCLPDLPYLFGGDVDPPEPHAALPEIQPQFAECASPPPEPPQVAVLRPPALARMEPAALRRWADTLGAARGVLVAHRREDVQILAAVPLGPTGSALALDPHGALLQAGAFEGWRDGGAGSAGIQLAWPWIGGEAGGDRLGALAPPDGTLAGVLARNALLQGTFRSAAGAPLFGIRRLHPEPNVRAVRTEHPASRGSGLMLSLDQRVCVLSRSPTGLRLGSDVTTAAEPTWRHGGPSRLWGALKRHLARVGERYVFEPAGPRTRSALARELAASLDQVVQAGGLATGPAGEPAYSVRCDARTHTQADLDAGRLVAEILVRPVGTIEAITVVLTLADGTLSLSEAA